ncbi:MAG: DUF6036 family nucleotidyltransferase [Rhizomicrobium sp.]
MTASSDCYTHPMSSKHPHLYIERPIYQAARDLIRQTESSINRRLAEPIRLVMTGGAAMALYSPTRSSEDVDAIFSHRIVLPEVLVPYVDEHGQRRTLTWDRNYAPVLGLLHPDAEEDAIFVAQSPDNLFNILVLAPVDLAVSKLSRYADNDQRDVQELYDQGLITPQVLEARARAAMDFYVGNLGQVQHNILTALAGMGYHASLPSSEHMLPETTRLRRNDAQRIAEGGGSDLSSQCLSRGQITGKLISLSEDRSVAFMARAGNLIAVYRSDCLPMPELASFKGKLIALHEQKQTLIVHDRGLKGQGKGNEL